MSVTEQELADKAAEVIRDAILEEIHDRMGQCEQLEDELEGLTEEESEIVLGRYEYALKRYLPVQVYDVADLEFRPMDPS